MPKENNPLQSSFSTVVQKSKKKKKAVTAGKTYVEGGNGKMRVKMRTAGTISGNVKDG